MLSTGFSDISVICNLHFLVETFPVASKTESCGTENKLNTSTCINLARSCSDSHHVCRDKAKVDGNGSEGEEVAGAVVFMDPAAEVLQGYRSPLELLGQGQQQQQHVGEQEDRELEDGWEQPAEDDERKGKRVSTVEKILVGRRIKNQEESNF